MQSGQSASRSQPGEGPGVAIASGRLPGAARGGGWTTQVFGHAVAEWRAASRAPPLGSVGGLRGTIRALAAGLAVGVTIGSLPLWLGNVSHASALPKVWRTWWLGDFTGALVVVPLALAWFPWPKRAWWRRRA